MKQNDQTGLAFALKPLAGPGTPLTDDDGLVSFGASGFSACSVMVLPLILRERPRAEDIELRTTDWAWCTGSTGDSR